MGIGISGPLDKDDAGSHTGEFAAHLAIATTYRVDVQWHNKIAVGSG